MNPIQKKIEWASKNRTYYLVFRNIAFIAAQFSLIVIILLTVNLVNVLREDPLERERMDVLIERSQNNPSDSELVEFIRGVDLIARRAYFAHLAFNRFGVLLLIGGVAVLLVSLKVMERYKLKLPAVSQEQTSPSRNRGFIAVAAAGGTLIAAAFIIPLFFQKLNLDYLADVGLKIEEGQKTAYPLPEQEALKKNWPAFRGYHSTGVSTHKNVPADWDVETGANIAWKTDLDLPGFNSPILWEDKIFLSGADRENRVVYCYQAETGQLDWQKNVDTSVKEVPNTAEDTGFAASSMATNGVYVYAIFATGTLVCLDFDGQTIWQKELGIPDNHYGHASSLLTYEKYVYVQFDQFDKAVIIAYDYATGQILWSQRREVDTSWASPVLAEHGNKVDLLLNAAPLAASYQALDGKLNWELDIMFGEVGPSMAFVTTRDYPEGIAFAVNEYAVLAAIDMSQGEVIWETLDNLPEASSPVAVGDYLVLPTSWGMLSCLAPESGEVYWTMENGHGFYSSPVIAEEQIYIADLDGVMHIIQLSKEQKVINQIPFGEPVYATPAIQDGRLVVRSSSKLYLIRDGS